MPQILMTDQALPERCGTLPRRAVGLASAFSRTTVLAALAVLPLTFFAQDLKPHAKLDKDLILIGQQANVELSITYRVDQGAQAAIQWPTVTDTLTEHIEVVLQGAIDTLLPEKDKDPYLFRQTRTLAITSWDSGYWAVPPFRFVINGDTAETEALLLTVNTVQVDTAAAFKDIKEIYEVPYSWKDWLQENWPWVVGGAAALAALISVIVWLVRRKRKPASPTPLLPEKPLHVRTLLALEDLDKKKLWQQGLVKEYHSGVTDILRGYIEERFEVPAMESTTDELLASLRMSSMNAGQREQLANLLRMADMVKFAKWTPISTENEQLMAGAIKLVQQTTDPLGDAQRP
jgi:hypothetical protein